MYRPFKPLKHSENFVEFSMYDIAGRRQKLMKVWCVTSNTPDRFRYTYHTFYLLCILKLSTFFSCEIEMLNKNLLTSLISSVNISEKLNVFYSELSTIHMPISHTSFKYIQHVYISIFFSLYFVEYIWK